VRRTYVYATPNRGVCRRAWSYFTFMAAAAFTGLFCIRKPDVLVATSPQLLAGVAGAIVAAFRRVPFVFEVRDLWPESIVAVGAMRNRLVLAPLYALANVLYRRARRIVLVSDASRAVLADRGIPKGKLRVIKNGVDLSLFRPGRRDNWVRQSHGLGDSFTVLYIGTLGMAHGLEVVLDASRRISGKADVTFLLVGEGARKEELRAGSRDLPNVRFVDGCPRARVPDYIAASDACLVHLKRCELFRTVLPSKMFEIMACARPILLGVEGEAQRTLERAHAGVAFPPEDGAGLAKVILRLRSDRGALDRMGRQGRRFVERGYSRDVLARRYAELLRACCDGNGFRNGTD